MKMRAGPAIAAAAALILLALPWGAEASEKPSPAAPAKTSAAPARTSGGIEVSWGGRWWPAEILERRAGLIKIHYTGYGPEWDEWVEPSRMRVAAPRAAFSRGRVGQAVEIEWQGSYWSGTIIAVRSGFYKVHYTGWGPEWDEWVEPKRLRTVR